MGVTQGQEGKIKVDIDMLLILAIDGLFEDIYY